MTDNNVDGRTKYLQYPLVKYPPDRSRIKAINGEQTIILQFMSLVFISRRTGTSIWYGKDLP